MLLGQEDFVLDVKGRTTSTLGLFAFAVLGIAGFRLTVLALNTLRRRRASHRLVRGLPLAVGRAAGGGSTPPDLPNPRIPFAAPEGGEAVVCVPMGHPLRPR